MGREMYLLHDNGRKLFTSPDDCTPMQRFLYVMAKDYHSDEPDTPSNPGGIEKARDFNSASPI